MGQNVLLLNYSGYPDYTSYFLVENGLAYLASCLMQHGATVTIRDHVTVDTAQRLYPYEYATSLRHYRDAIMSEILTLGRAQERTLNEARELDGLINERNRRVAMEIARELDAEIKRLHITVLGVKLWTQPALRDVMAMLHFIRNQNPALRIIAGGGHVDYFLGRVLTSIPELDAAAFADGEMALVRYVQYLDGKGCLQDIPNLVYRLPDGSITMNPAAENPEFSDGRLFPTFDGRIYPAMSTLSQKMFTLPFEDSRGCQFKCGFCAHPIKSGNLRLRSVDAVVDELEHLNQRFGFVSFTGSGSNTPFVHACRVYEEIKRRGLDLAINFFQSLRDFNIGRAQIMRESHIPLFWVGIETAAQGLLDQTFNKKRNMERTKQVCEFFNEANIGYITSLIYPGLGETEETMRDTIRFIQEVGKGHVVIYPPLLQPRTPWMNSPHVQLIDREAFLNVSQFGLEEIENRVLPPMVSDDQLNSGVLLNGKSYREIYYENMRFRAEMDRVCEGERGHKREFCFTPALAPFMQTLNDTFWTIDQSLHDGDFDRARQAMTRFNHLATAGSISATSSVGASAGNQRVPRVIMRSGGPA